MTKVFIVLTSVLSVVLSSLAIAFAAQVSNWRALAEAYQAARDDAVTKQQTAVASAEAALAAKELALGERALTLTAAHKQIDELNDRLARARTEASQSQNEKLAAEAGRTKLQEILDVQTGELKALQKQNETLLAQNIDLQSRNARTNTRVLELTTNVTILTEQIRNLQEKLHAAEQQVAALQQRGAPGAGAPPQPPAATAAVVSPVKGPIRGQITQLSDSYAAINVGESSGVVVGMTFMVYREGGVYLGELVIERVEPKAAGGRIRALAAGEVRVGDQVSFGLN